MKYVRGMILVSLGCVVLAGPVTEASIGASPYGQWTNGPSASKEFFPICVWLQNPARAAQYREAGFNVYVGLWRGPTVGQLAQLREAGMQVVCHQNEVGLSRLDDPTIIGWMHQDEPDNAQSLGPGRGYGPPVAPEEVVRGYERVRAADPSRPILLNLGQAVAWDGWHGRGVRSGHPEDYPRYVKGCDIASFDIYPATHSRAEVAGKLWYVALGVERLTEWTQGRQIVWNCIECTHIHNSQRKPTPHEVRCEVWMSIIHGSMGLIYFVHEWEPKFNESALLSDPQMCAAVTRINRRILKLAPVLNGPDIDDAVLVVSQNSDVPIAAMVKRHGNSVYLFAVAMRAGSTSARFTIRGLAGEAGVEVLDEDRRLTSRAGVFEDDFQSWDVHLYRIGQSD